MIIMIITMIIMILYVQSKMRRKHCVESVQFETFWFNHDI